MIELLQSIRLIGRSEKLLDSYNFKKTEWLVLSDSGFSPIHQVHKTKSFRVYDVELDNGMKIRVADNHIFYTAIDYFKQCKELKIGDDVLTVDGISTVKRIVKLNEWRSMYDLSVMNQKYSYYTNDILSHNTITSSIFITHFITFNFEKNVLIMANKGETMEEIIDKGKVIIDHLPFFMKPGIVVDNVKSMRFDNDCRIIGQATSKSPAIGFTIHLAFLDEFAHIPANICTKFYRAIYPTISASKVAKMIICSTPNGKNLFYKLYDKAIKGLNSYHPIRVDWYDVPGRDDAWVQETINNLDTIEDFKQEYENQFLAGDSLLLNGKDLKQMTLTSTNYIDQSIDVLDDTDIDYNKSLKWHPKFNFNNIKENDRFFATVDLSEGDGGDYLVQNYWKLVPLSLKQISNIKNFSTLADFFGLLQIGTFHNNVFDFDEFSYILKTLTFDVFNEDNIRLAIEMNFDGKSVIKELKTHDDFFDDVVISTYHSDKHDYMKLGILLRGNNKARYIKTFKRNLRKGRIIITDNKTKLEFQNFGKKGESQIGNDDLAMTGVFTSCIFESNVFEQSCEDAFDELPMDYQNMIMEKLDGKGIDDDDFDADFLRNLMK